MTKQKAPWDDLWNLDVEELEDLLAADENLLDLQRKPKRLTALCLRKH